MENDGVFDIVIQYISSIINEIFDKYEVDRSKLSSEKFIDSKNNKCCHFGYTLSLINSGGKKKTERIGSPIVVISETGDIICGKFEKMVDFSHAVDQPNSVVKTSLLDDQTIRSAIEDRICLLTGN